MTTRFVELSHVITPGMATYPGLPTPVITPHLSREASRDHYAPGTEFTIDTITMCGNTGTYMDSPFHRYPEGGDLTSIDLARTVDLPAVVLRISEHDSLAVDAEDLAPVAIAGCALLIHSGDDARFGTAAYRREAHYLTEAGAHLLAEREVALVGIDAINIDRVTEQGPRPAHSILLAAGIPIVEHLTGLGSLPLSGATFTAVPLRIRGLGTVSVRAYAKLPGAS